MQQALEHVQRLPAVADAREHRATHSIEYARCDEQRVSHLCPAFGADVKAVGGTCGDGACGAALVAVHDVPRVVRDGPLAHVAAPTCTCARCYKNGVGEGMGHGP